MLKEKFQALSKEALRNKDADTRRMMGSILSRFLETEKAPGFKGWTDDAEQEVVRAHIKALQKSVDAMPGSAVAQGYEQEIALLTGYLPRMYSEEEARAVAAPYAEKANGRLGPFMGMVLKDHKGMIDPGLLRKIGQELGLS